MKNLFLLLLFLSSISGYTQPNWKDSVKTKEVVLDAYKLNDLIYFRTKKGWGAYWPVQDYMAVKPGYQFLMGSFDQPMNEFYAIKKNKLILIDNNGKQLNKRVYKQAGNCSFLDQSYAIDDFVCINVNKDVADSKMPYRQLSPYDEYSITVKNNLVYINTFRESQSHNLISIVHGDYVDSIDAAGNLVTRKDPPVAASGIYDLKTMSWVVPLSNCKVGYCQNNSLALNVTVNNNELISTLTVFDKSMKSIGKFPLEDAFTKAEACKLILSDYNPVFVEACYKDNYLSQLFKFDTGKKQGLYNPFTFSVIIEPLEYDFIMPSQTFDQNIFTLKNGKAGFMHTGYPEIVYQNDYSKLIKISMNNNYMEQTSYVMNCDDNDVELMYRLDTGGIITREFLMNLKGFRQSSGIQNSGDFVIVHDFIPKEIIDLMPIQLVDMDGNIRDSIIIEPSGEEKVVYMTPDPGKSLGGVFNKVSRKWVVPREFSKISATDAGFACVRNYKDTISYSFYSKDGKSLFKSISQAELIANSDFMSKFSGSKLSAALQAKTAFDFNLFYPGMPAILKDGKKAGVFDLHNLSWIIEPIFDLIDYNEMGTNYSVVSNNRLGIYDLFGTEVISPMYNRIEFNFLKEGFIINDSLFCEIGYPFKKTVIDTNMHLSRFIPEGDFVSTKPFFKAEIINKKLYVEESEIDFNTRYDEVGEIFMSPKYNSRSRMVDPLSGKEKFFKSATRIVPWKAGHLILDTASRWLYLNERDEPTIISRTNNLQVNENYAFASYLIPNFVMDFSGQITYVTDLDNSPVMYGEASWLGSVMTYFDGKELIDLPADFYLLAMNKAKLGIGFTLTKNGDGSFDRKYIYFDFNSRTFIPMEMEFSPKSNLEVIDLGSYYVYFTNESEKSALWLMEGDLKTIKSSFTNLTSISTQITSTPETKVILFELVTKAGKQMFFDKEFQYILEADAGSYQISYPGWNRLMLKYNLNTVKMNHEGQIVNK